MGLAAFAEGIGMIASGTTFFWLIGGVLLGIIIGALPGLGPSLGMAILLPLTAPMEAGDAIILLVSIYSGAMYGGAISAILLNAPGTAAAAATTFEGYPMSRKGDALKALAISATASATAGFMTIIVIILMMPLLVDIVLAFQSPEYFLIAFLGLAMITVIAKGSILKGLTAGMFGLMITTVGTSPMAVQPRYAYTDYFDFTLTQGIDFVAVLIGLFAIAEMFNLAGEKGGISRTGSVISGSVIPGIKTVFKYPVNLVKSAFIGLGIGAIPGAGSTVSTFVAYGESLRSSKNPEEFGKGSERGLIAAESSNNGTIGGSLVPTLSFGIPGSAATAVLLGGLIMHGLNPGPLLFSDELATTYSIYLALFIGNILILTVGLLFITRVSFITKVNAIYIIPIIIVFAVIGAYAIRGGQQAWLDVFTVLMLGIIGYYMKKYDYSIIAFVLGVVLGSIAEENLDRSLQISEGSWYIFVDPINQPLSFGLVIVIILLLFGPFLKSAINKVRGNGE